LSREGRLNVLPSISLLLAFINTINILINIPALAFTNKSRIYVLKSPLGEIIGIDTG